jgi:hypothetical protein
MKKLVLLSLLLLILNYTYSQENPEQKKISWLQGTWEGKGLQIDEKTWDVSFTHVDKKFTISYPSLACNGWWELKKSDKTQLEFIEHITVNNGCDQGVKVIVTRIDDKNISIVYFIPDQFGD